MNKKQLKIIIPSALVVILMLTVFLMKTNVTTKSSRSAEINGLKLEQNINYGTAKIVSYDKENNYIKAVQAGYEIDEITNMVIPEAVEIDGDNYKITEIGENAFSDANVFKTVSIPVTVEKIGSGAFTGCENLTKIILSNPKTVIASDAFDTTEENADLVLSYNGEDAKDLNELENKIIVKLNSSDVINIGKVQWNNYKAEVKLSTEYEKYTLQYRVNGGDWTEGTTVSSLNVNDKVEARLTYGESSSNGFASYTVVETTKPTVSLEVTNVTDSTITVEAVASDGQSGLNGEYKWYLESTLKDTTETNTYTFEGLTDNTSYTLKVEVADNCSNTADATASAKTDINLSNHTSSSLISFKNLIWENGWAKININTDVDLTKATLVYQVNGYTEGGWQTTTNDATISNLAKDDVVYAKIVDEESSTEDYATYTVAYANDTTKPTVTLAVTNVTDSTITVEATASDGQTGLNGEYKWYLGDTLKETTETNTYTFEGLTDYTSYTLKVEVADNCSNTANITASAKTDINLSNHTSSSLISFSNFKYNSAGYYTINIKTSAPLTKATLLYQVNGYTDDGWKTTTNNATISNLAKDDVVYAKLLIDEENFSTGYASYTVVDNKPVINNFYRNYYGTDYIDVYYSVKDDMGIQKIEIYCDGSLQTTYTPNSTTKSGSYTVYGLSSGSSYNMKIVVTDTAGQTTEQTETMYTDTEYCGGDECYGC